MTKPTDGTPDNAPESPVLPSQADLDAVAAEQAAKQATAGPDTSKVDSLGNVKTDLRTFGPQGVGLPGDTQTAEQRKAADDARDAKLGENMPDTSAVDSVGSKKGHFAVIPQGFDKHGARIPDKVDWSTPIETVAQHAGPRGKGAPKDTFHG